MRRPEIRSDRGSALVLVLVLLTVLALGLGALFSDAGANLTTSNVITAQNNKMYAADAGIEMAIQKLRGNSSLCAGPAPQVQLTGIPTTVNGAAIAVACQTTAGLATSVSPWALVTTDPGSASLGSQGGSATSAKIKGPIYTRGGVDFQSPVQVDSHLYQYSPTCVGTPAQPNDVSESNPGNGPVVCTQASTPDPAPVLPPFQFTPEGPGPAFTANGCSIFLPGEYTSTGGRGNGSTNGILLGAHNYFASGVYYFLNTAIRLQGSLHEDLLGGRPGTGESQVITTASPCDGVTDKEAGIDNGTGVELILGGSSLIRIGSSAMELYSRIPDTGPEGTAGISIRTVPANSTQYTPYSIRGGQDVLTMSSGAQVAVHGMVYVPQAPVDVFASNSLPAGAAESVVATNAAVLEGGLQCSDLTIGPNASGSNGEVVSAQIGSQSRYVVVNSTAQPSGSGKSVSSTAVVAIANGPLRTVTIESWIDSAP